MSIADEKYIALTTYRKNGEGVTTPVWVNPVSDGRIGFWTSMGSGKTKRMRNNPQVTVQASDARGRTKKGSTPITGTAEMVQSGPLFDEVQAKGKKKYGVMVTISKAMGQLLGQRKAGQTYADTVVLIRLDQQ
ncbi:MAG: PPOX class F420-dependent oxidoreductase [Marmoricola sp.]